MPGSSTEVLQEYLVKLGFQTDAISLRKFEDGLGSTGKKVLGIGTAVAGVVASVEAATAAFAYSMRRMYFQSDLSGTTVKNLQAVSYAGKQLGISAEAMQGAVKSASMAMYLNPGLKGYAAALTGISVEGRKTDDVLLELVKSTEKYDEFVGAGMMADFGMDAETYRLLRGHTEEFKRMKEAQLSVYKEMGVDIDAQRNTMLSYTTAIDKLESKLGVVGTKWLSSMSPAFMETTKFLDKLLDIGAALADGIIGDAVYDFFHPEEKRAKKKGPSASGKITPAPGAPASNIIEIHGRNPGEMTSLPERNFGPKTSPVATSGSGSAQATMAMLQQLGWSPEQAAGLTANIQRESQFNPSAVGDKGQAYGIGQWHKDRQAEFRKWAGKDIQGSSYEDQVRFMSYELKEGKEKAAGQKLAGAKTAYDAGYIASKHYERPRDVEGEAVLRGAEAARLGGGGPANVAIHQTTTIQVSGTDASSTGKAVAKVQDDVNQRIVRNTKRAMS